MRTWEEVWVGEWKGQRASENGREREMPRHLFQSFNERWYDVDYVFKQLTRTVSFVTSWTVRWIYRFRFSSSLNTRKRREIYEIFDTRSWKLRRRVFAFWRLKDNLSFLRWKRKNRMFRYVSIVALLIMVVSFQHLLAHKSIRIKYMLT